MTADVLTRLVAGATVAESGCWEWQRCLNSRGYGVISVAGKRELAHRVSYSLNVGEIPAGLTIDHLCRNKACVNPAHLEPVTDLENKRRSPRFNKTHCVHGHALTDDNLIVRTRTNGTVMKNCRTCTRSRLACIDFCDRYLDRKPTRAELAEWLDADAQRQDVAS